MQNARRVLICDDAPEFVAEVTDLLTSEGFEVLLAYGGREALDIVKRHPIDLLLLDLQMPRVDGFEVLEYLQEHRQHLPVILLSGMKPDDIQMAMRTLSSRTLPPLLLKPFTPGELLDVIQMKLGDGHAQA